MTCLPPPRKLRDIADGLHYLHSHRVVHGDLKGVRVDSESRFTTVIDAWTSRTSLWMPPAMRGSQILVSPRTLLNWMSRMIKATPRDGLRRRS